MKHFVAAFAGCVALVFAGQAVAAAPVTITSTSHVARHVKVTFTMPANWTPNVISIAKKPDVGSDGSFFTENIVDAGILSKGQTEFLSSNQLDYGTYYIRIQTYQDDFMETGWSDTATVTIAAPPPPPPTPTPSPSKPTDYNICVTTGSLEFGMIGFDKNAPCRKVTTLRMKQVVQITSDLTTGTMCIRYRTGHRCEFFGATAIVSAKNVINSRFTVYLKKAGAIVQTKVYRVLPAKK